MQINEGLQVTTLDDLSVTTLDSLSELPLGILVAISELILIPQNGFGLWTTNSYPLTYVIQEIA